MKKIFFLRHAKSSWSDFSLKDFDRPLSTRGIQDAKLMGNYFKAKNIDLDIVISSPSKRTKETLKHLFSNNAPACVQGFFLNESNSLNPAISPAPIIITLINIF